MAIRFFFEYNNTVVQLPVNPEHITISLAGNNKTEEIVKLGEINILKEPRLHSCSINCFLPVNSNAPYVLTGGRFEPPQFYIDFFNKIIKNKKPCRFIISGTFVNMFVSIEGFDYTLKAGDDDTHYVLNLKEYRSFSAKVVKIQPNTNKATTSANTRVKTGFAIGDTVIVNGKYWYDSYGASPFGTFSNFTGKISHIVSNKSRPYRYHITTIDGRWRGWVAENQITHK
jgi:hypothetical protein